MLQTIDRALTILVEMTHEDRYTILQAGTNARQEELETLRIECVNIVHAGIEMETRNTQNGSRVTNYDLIKAILDKSAARCATSIEWHKTLLTTDKQPIFLSAMAYYSYRSLQCTKHTGGYNTFYPTLLQHCTEKELPEIHESKRPKNARDVIQLVEKETIESIIEG
jgi:hypothetical protein